ncbi:NAD-dependent epimerase/dehydratase family protein [Sphingobacterium deserti]|uniref:Epimerase n=1 Tax=Sphingobacterium deserti TaxID=1229276 RepID=A0A0B8T3U0_9SPHI|nr:NAD-dependent epimerase/dehydratase family protein [Sphingobacterium deserti]KGE15901.1 epimerase [Sphingobacterium deserti]
MRYLILGCGWVGEALAKTLLQKGHQVYASTTDSEKYQRLQALGISAILADFDREVDLASFPGEVDFVLNSIPAVKRLEQPLLEARFASLKEVLKHLTYRKQIFLSSIGVYPDVDGDFTESSALDAKAYKLYAAEECMLTLANTVVYRLGGLFGDQRIFAKYFQDKVCHTGAQLANFIHQDDVLNLIVLGFEQNLSSSCYNLVAPAHPTKREVVLASAAKYGFKPPSAFEDREKFKKQVIGDKILQELHYVFKYPSPLDF